MKTVILIVIIIVLVSLIGVPGYRLASGRPKRSKKDEAETQHDAHLREIGVEPLTGVEMGKYIGGHSDTVDWRGGGRIYRSSTDLLLYNKRYTFKKEDTKNTLAETAIDFLDKISLSAIKEITVAKQSVVQQQVATGLLTVTTAAALAWAADKKTDRAFLIINWADSASGFTRNTIFEYDGIGAFANANRNRDQLLRLIKS